MKISTVVFDAYGTLFDTADGSVRATRDILLKCRSPLAAAKVYERWKTHMKEITSNLTAFISEEKIFVAGLGRTYEDFGIVGRPEEDVGIMLATLGVRKLFPDAFSCVDRLRDRCEIAIASNTDSGSFLEDLRRSQLIVDKWFTSESLRAYKPHRSFYDRMLSALGKKPGEVAFVGDSLEADVLGPRARGMHGIWLNRGEEKELSDHSEVPEIATLAELYDLIAAIRANP